MSQTIEVHLEQIRKVAQSVRSRLNTGKYRDCLFCEKTSQRKKVKGHSIQRALLSKFLAENGHVIMLKNDKFMKLVNGQMPELSASAKLVGVRQATTGYFTCSEHDRIFEPIERGNLDLNRNSHLFLFALRAIAYQTWRVKTVRNAWSCSIKENDSVPDVAVANFEIFSNALQRVDKILRLMTGWYNGERYERIKHKVLQLKASPTLAVCDWSAFGDPSYLDYGLTVLPINASHTTAIIHYFEKDTDKLRDSLGHLLAATKQKRKHILSRVIIEDFENVTLSPRVWNQFNPEKQQRIQKQFLDTMENLELHRLVNIQGEEHLNFFID